MKAPALLALTSFLLLASLHVAAADQSAPAFTPLRPVSRCLRPDRINEWSVVDNQTVIARTGPTRYLVRLRAECPKLGIGQSLRFNSNRANQNIGWGALCGEAGETVSSRDQPPCAVQSVEIIDRDQFDQLSNRATQRGRLP